RSSPFLPLIALIVLLAPMSLVSAQTNDADVTVPPWRQELPDGRQQAEIVVGETPLTVDLAFPGSQQSLGLGYRNGLEPGTGMFFIGEQPTAKTYWMKGMRFCLDIIWIEDGEIVGAAEDA